MSPQQYLLRDRFRLAVTQSDSGSLADLIESTIRQTRRRARKEKIHDINTAIMDCAVELDRPDLIPLLRDIPHENLRALCTTLINQYIKTRNEAWFAAVTTIIRSLEKKSDQSEVMARLSRMLIEAGSAQSDQILIQRGMDLFNSITFRKYRSEILSQISPFLIDWAVSQGNVSFLHSLQTITEEIADIPKKSVIQARIADAIAAIGIAQDNIMVWADGIRTAANIRQKTRRQTCFLSISRKASGSPLYTKIIDISGTLSLLTELKEEIRLEIISALLEQVLSQEENRQKITDIISVLARTMPETQVTIVASLLNRSELTGDPWYFSRAIEMQERIEGSGEYPVREFVKAALSVVRTTGTVNTLQQIVPAVESSCTPLAAARILLQITQVLLTQGELTEALAVFSRVSNEVEKNPLYDECCITIWKHAIVAERVTDAKEVLTVHAGSRTVSDTIYRAVSDICKHHAFNEIAQHVDSVAAVMSLHPQRDQLILDSITSLIQRGFLDAADPDVLIRLSRSIEVLTIREQALSTIVIRLAKLGVATRNRDFLQRSVGLTCLIEDEKTRSTTLTAIIDAATVLAVADGDLDLLRRMREWSASLLSQELELIARVNLIEGMITYAADRRFHGALEEAYQIAAEIGDPSIRKDVTDRISESYIKIGCLLFQDLSDHTTQKDYLSAFGLFERGFEILTAQTRQEERSLKLAHVIDIIFDCTKERFRIDTVLPLTLFALEIRNAYERDAMVIRIASMVRMLAEQSDSTDPYEGIVQVLLRNKYVQQDPSLLDLVQRTIILVKDPFSRFSLLSRLAGLFLQIHEHDRAATLLDGICSSLDEVQGSYRQVLLLGDCAIHYTRISEEQAKKAIVSGLNILQMTDYDPDAAARRHLVIAMARLNEAKPDESLVSMALDVVGQIREPVDFIGTMLPVYRMAAGNAPLRHEIVNKIRGASESIIVPVQKAPVLLNLANLMISNGDYSLATTLLPEIAETARTIRIPFLADIIRSRIAEAFIRIWHHRADPVCIKRALEIIGEIEHEEIRLSAAALHQSLTVEVSPLYLQAKGLAERMITERFTTGQIAGLDNLIRSEPDRGIIARYFCMIAILFNSTGKTRLAHRYYDMILKEAGVIRPLPRRAYVLCDVALMLADAGCRTKSQEVMGLAADAATGIRQFSDRDEVFDNLAATMRWMQEA